MLRLTSYYLVCLLLLSTFSKAQVSKKDSLWLPFNYFVGEWIGTSNGEPGIGMHERSYKWILDKRYIEVNSKATYVPSDANDQKGEVHEDAGYFSYDKNRKVFKLRQFHVEGFVNEFVLDSISPDKKTIVFVTESIENIPTGWRAKEMYRILNENEIEETFELAGPGKDFELYTRVKLRRQK